MRISIAFSVFNQGQNITKKLTNIVDLLDKHTSSDSNGITAEIIILDNSSTDGTPAQIFKFLSERKVAHQLSVIDTDRVLGPSSATNKLLEVAIGSDSDYVIKLDLNQECSSIEALDKFLEHLKQSERPHQQLLTSLSVCNKWGPAKRKKYRTTFLATELRATSNSSQYFQDQIGDQLFPTEVLKQVMNSPKVQSHAGRRGWDFVLPLEARKLGYELITIPIHTSEHRPVQRGVKFQDHMIENIWKKLARNN